VALDRAAWRATGRARLLYSGGLILAFLMFVSYIKWQVWSTHHHLPLFVLAAPLAGAVLGGARASLGLIVAALAFLAATPWALANHIRPLVAWPGLTPFPSILTQPRSAVYFYTAPEIEQRYRQAVAAIVASGCDTVGLSIGLEEGAEYLVWVLLDEAGTAARVEHVDFEWEHRNPSKRLVAPFEPCAVFHVWYDNGLAVKYAEQMGGEIHQFENVYAIVPGG
jgi:hypothetical protein